MKLREYQADLINKIRHELKQGRKSVCAVLGCGGGKSVIQAMIAKSATDKGNRVLFLIHRKELQAQICRTFALCSVDMNLCDIGMVQTVTRRISYLQPPLLMITDECHHALSSSYRRIYNAFPNAVRLGFTATPCRLGVGGLGDVFDSMVEGVTTRWLIDNGYLADYDYYSVKLVDTSGLHTKRGEFDTKDVAALMDNRCIYGEAFKTWLRLANGKKTIVYCATIQSSKETVRRFCENGIAAAHLDGTTPNKERAEVIQKFRTGEITVLSNVDLFGEGFDVPDCECVILLRPTKSLTLHIQQSMRSMRYQEGKRAIIIDHVANVYRHGLPDDAREWTLEAKKNKAAAEISPRECPECFAVLKNTEKICPKCGYVFQTKERKNNIAAAETELEKISHEDLKNARYEDYKKIHSWDEMEQFRKAKNYKFLWSIYKCKELGIVIPPKYNGVVRRFAR